MGLTISSFLLSTIASLTTVVAVVDSGYTPQKGYESIPLCSFGHAKYLNGEIVPTEGAPKDSYSSKHGTNVAEVLWKSSGKPKNLCFIIVSIFNPPDRVDEKASAYALKHLLKYKIDVVNLSYGGEDFVKEEAEAIKDLIDSGAIVVAAAGNEGKVLNVNKKNKCLTSPICRELGLSNYFGTFYPAMADPRVIVVGSLDMSEQVHRNSNRGQRVNAWEIGEAVCVVGICLTGTSQAAPKRAGKIVKEITEKRRQNEQ